jgi:glycosyltransferase involved in cell wall biosynthesis
VASVLIFHGYLLGGTGSNVYNARLAQALVRLGHDVHLLCQERHPERLGFVDASADWDDAGRLRVHSLRAGGGAGEGGAPAGSCTVYRPDIGGLLPVYVADPYEGLEARTFADCSDAEIARYVEANVAAVAEVEQLAAPQLALANHLVMGPVILARALADTPYAVKVHGSALEYTVKPEPERFLEPAREGLDAARAVLVGSRHTAESLWATIGRERVRERTRLGPPGVDIEGFQPREPTVAFAGVRALAERLERAEPDEQELAQSSAFARDSHEAATALGSVREDDLLVAFVGKLIVSKGPDLLVAAWPLVLQEIPRARLMLVGFGAYRTGLARLSGALQDGDLEQAREIALAGRSLENGASAPAALGYLLAFLDGLRGGERERYVAAAGALEQRVLFSGRLEHDELEDLLPACRALVVPSTFPEAFGMVAAEAAACGVLPISAAHSGLAEVSDALAGRVPPPVRDWLSFELGEDSVTSLAARLVSWLSCGDQLREQTRAALVATVRERWSWERVATGVLAAAAGRLEELAAP